MAARSRRRSCICQTAIRNSGEDCASDDVEGSENSPNGAANPVEYQAPPVACHPEA
jgi:hypothetical protein